MTTKPAQPQPDLSAPIYLGKTWLCPTGHVNGRAARACWKCRWKR
jgi:hypothetical protein